MRTVLARSLALCPVMLSLLWLGALTTKAASPVVQETVPIQSVLPGSVPDPCNGDPIAWTGKVHLAGAMTTDASGGAVFRAHVDFENVHGTDATTGAPYTVTLASNESVVFAPSSPNLPSPNIVTQTIRFNLISHGPAPNFYEDEVGHYTITPAGQIVVAFANVGTSCSG